MGASPFGSGASSLPSSSAVTPERRAEGRTRRARAFSPTRVAGGGAQSPEGGARLARGDAGCASTQFDSRAGARWCDGAALQVSGGRSGRADAASVRVASAARWCAEAPATTTPAVKAPRRKAAKATPAAASAPLAAHLAKKTIADLKAMLRKNDQLVTGTRPELVERVVDRVTHGNLPRCPQCFLGRLRLNRDGSMTCPGGYDDDEYKECGFTAPAGAVERPAWQFETAGLA